jgi:hypothetical protein
MNRIRVFTLTGVLAVGGLGFAALPAQAQAPRVAAPAPAPAPRLYYYGPGYGGYGYYSYPAAPTAPTYSGGFYSAPAPIISRGTPARRSVQDYTGRHDGLARPWLRPLQ